MFQYFAKTLETHVYHFLMWRHILRHCRHLLALHPKNHYPTFRLDQLIHVWYTILFVINVCAKHFYDLTTLALVFGLHKENYLQILKCVSLWLHFLLLVRRWRTRKPVKPHQLNSCSCSNWPWVDLQSLCNRNFWLRFCVATLLC